MPIHHNHILDSLSLLLFKYHCLLLYIRWHINIFYTAVFILSGQWSFRSCPGVSFKKSSKLQLGCLSLESILLFLFLRILVLCGIDDYLLHSLLYFIFHLRMHRINIGKSWVGTSTECQTKWGLCASLMIILLLTDIVSMY